MSSSRARDEHIGLGYVKLRTQDSVTVVATGLDSISSAKSLAISEGMLFA
jgi:hypothetical protein